MPQAVGYFLVVAVLLLTALSTYWFWRARRLTAELEASRQKLAELEKSQTSRAVTAPEAQPTKEPSQFELAQLKAHLQAEEQAHALLTWESEGGRTADLDEPDSEQIDSGMGDRANSPDQPKPRRRHFKDLWLDIGGEGG